MHRLRRNPRRGRTVTLAALAAVLVSPLAGLWLIDHEPLHFRWPESRTAELRYSIVRNRPHVLLLGSSRMACSIDLEKINGLVREGVHNPSFVVFESAMPAGEPNTARDLATLLLSDGPAPRLVVVDVCPEFVAHGDPFLRYYLQRLFKTRQTPAYLTEFFVSGNGERWIGSRLVPFSYYRSELRRWMYGTWLAWTHPDPAPAVAGPDAPLTTFDWPKKKKDDVPSEKAAASRAFELRKFQRAANSYRLGGPSADAMDELLALLHQRDIPVVLVWFPVISGQRDAYTPQALDQYNQYIHRLIDKYGCAYVDLSDRIPDDTDFYDGYHAVVEAALRFTPVLVNEAILPQLNRIAP